MWLTNVAVSLLAKILKIRRDVGSGAEGFGS